MPRRILAAILAAILAPASLLSAPGAGAQTFDLDAAPFGPVPFSVTSGGVTASFSSPASGFEILDASAFAPGSFAGLSGRFVGDANADIIVEPLTIQFGTPLSGLSLRFALFDALGATDFTLEAFLGATSVGSVGFTGALFPGFIVPEGSASFNAAPFDRVVLSSTAADFGIDDLVASPATVPEPATAGLVVLGLLALGGVARRRVPAR